MRSLYPVLYILAVSWAMSGLIALQVFLSRLRRLHAATWTEVAGLSNAGRFIRFMWRRDYEPLGNARTIAIARYLRGFLISYVVIGALTLAAFALREHVYR